MKIAIMQPTFLPWLGYFKMIKSVDAFIFLDSVQFERRSWQSRNRIKLQDKIHFLSLSCQKAPQKTPLTELRLDPELKWRARLLKTLHHGYAKAKNFKKYHDLLSQELYQNSHLVSLNINLIRAFCEDLGIKTPLFKASECEIPKAKRENLLLELCLYFKADSYLSPEGSKNYLETPYSKDLFAKNSIEICYFDFEHPIYPQQGTDFIPYLSAIDYLLNGGEGL